MHGLVFELSIPKYLLARGVGRTFPAVHYGRGSCLSLRELPPPRLPDPSWVRLRPLLAGLCGSDLGCIFFKTSPQLEPFNSFPAVLGHEVLAEVVELGPEAHTVAGARVEVGQRVTVNPLLPCRLRGVVPPCAACAAGRENGCERTAEGCLAPGLMLGFHRELPGGMGTEMVAHPSQLHPVPERLTDAQAVLVEPLAVAAHAVLRHPPRPGEQVLVIGGGPVAFATLWALRALGHRNRVTLLTVEPYQLELARQLGADDTLEAAPDLPEAEAVAARTGARVYRPILGPPALAGGFGRVYDCVGSQASLTDSLRYTRAFGTVVLIGAAGVLAGLDWTSVWRNELTVVGCYTYGQEQFRGRTQHTFDVVHTLLAEGAGFDPAPLVTHSFPLRDYGRAIEANLARTQHRSIKTVFDLRSAP